RPSCSCTAIMPSATITSATITSRRVKPWWRRLPLAAIEAFLADLERAVEITDEDHAPAGEIAIERSLERGHLPAREQDHVRLGRFVFFLVAFSVPGRELERRLEHEIAAFEAQLGANRLGKRVAREESVAGRIDPTPSEMIIHVEPVARFGEQ